MNVDKIIKNVLGKNRILHNAPNKSSLTVSGFRSSPFFKTKNLMNFSLIQPTTKNPVSRVMKNFLGDKDGDGVIAAADNDDNNPNNPRGFHYGDSNKRNKHRIDAWNKKDGIILSHAKENKLTIAGSRALKKQVNIYRKTKDWDIATTKPKRHAEEVVNALNTVAKKPYFFSVPSKFTEELRRVKEVGKDDVPNTSDDLQVADYFKPKDVIRSIEVEGVKYRLAKDIIDEKKRSYMEKHRRDASIAEEGKRSMYYKIERFTT